MKGEAVDRTQENSCVTDGMDAKRRTGEMARSGG